MEIQRLERYTPVLSWTFLAVSAIVLVHIILRNAWIAEDAYITYRVIDNFMNGYGLRWNINERVQAYTHPLWMLLHLPVYAIWPNIFLGSIALCLVCSLAAIAITLTGIRKPPLIGACCFLIPLAASKSFRDYATSGLENPLSFLLFACIGYLLLTKRNHPLFWFFISLSIALSLTNRLDTLVIFLPALSYLVLKSWKEVKWLHIIAGALPLIGWLAFSLFYYGFLFPNTKYAKLSTGFGTTEYIAQGIEYAKNFAYVDTAGFFILIVLGVVMTHAYLQRTLSYTRDITLWLAVGIFWNCAYVIYVGGDYMSGRFWALPVFAACWLIYANTPDRVRLDYLFTLLVLVALGYHMPERIKDVQSACKRCFKTEGNIMDARWIFSANALFKDKKNYTIRRQGEYKFRYDGRKLRDMEAPKVKREYFVGMVGFFAGAEITIIDENALADAFLARMPVSKDTNFYIAHFKRDLPKGYAYFLKNGSLERMDPNLAEYYKPLHLMISGDLFDMERLRTIVRFNLGTYDHWKEEYFAKERK